MMRVGGGRGTHCRRSREMSSASRATHFHWLNLKEEITSTKITTGISLTCACWLMPLLHWDNDKGWLGEGGDSWSCVWNCSVLFPSSSLPLFTSSVRSSRSSLTESSLSKLSSTSSSLALSSPHPLVEATGSPVNSEPSTLQGP